MSYVIDSNWLVHVPERTRTVTVTFEMSGRRCSLQGRRPALVGSARGASTDPLTFARPPASTLSDLCGGGRHRLRGTRRIKVAEDLGVAVDGGRIGRKPRKLGAGVSSCAGGTEKGVADGFCPQAAQPRRAVEEQREAAQRRREAEAFGGGLRRRPPVEAFGAGREEGPVGGESGSTDIRSL